MWGSELDMEVGDMGACEEKVNEREVGTEELKLSYVGEMNGKYV